MAVPYTFGTATAAIPLSQLDSNFATAITIGNTAVQLGNTVTTLNNMTLANVTISSGTITITNVAVTTANVSGTANISTLVVVGNETVGGNTTITGNITAANANVTTNLVLSGGTANGVAYLNGSKVLTTGSALVFDSTNLSLGTVSAKVNFSTTSSATVNYIGGSADGFSLEMVTQRGVLQPLTYKQDYGVGHVWSIAGSTSMTIAGATGGVGAVGIGYTSLTSVGNNGLAVLGNVGIGTSSPVYQTQIYGSGQTTSNLTDAGNKGGSLLLNTPTVSAGDGGALLFGAGGTGAKPFAAIKGLLVDGGGNTTGALAFSTRNATADTALTERMRIDSSGNLQLQKNMSVGGATPTTSGTGITFPATQSASSDANTLDDYEEGTWTPTLGGNTTYSARTGTYVKIGRLVTLNAYFAVTSIGTGSTTQITGIPFTAASGGSGVLNAEYTASLATAIVSITAFVNSNQIDISSRTAAATSASTNAIFGNGTGFEFTCTYIATA